MSTILVIYLPIIFVTDQFWLFNKKYLRSFKTQYKYKLIEKVELISKRMRGKAHLLISTPFKTTLTTTAPTIITPGN